MQIRVPKSIGFGAKRAEKSPYKRTIPYDASLGAGYRGFESLHSDQNFDRKRKIISAFGRFYMFLIEKPVLKSTAALRYVFI